MMILLLLSFSFGDVIGDIGDFFDNINEAQDYTSFEVLQIELDAPTGGMAGNYWGGGVHSIMKNPAEVGFKDSKIEHRTQTLFTHRTLFQGARANFIGYRQETNFGTVGLSILGMFSGEMELRDEIPGEASGEYSMEDLVFGVTYAKSFGELILGTTVRYLNERIFTESNSVYSFDFGIVRKFSINDKIDIRADFSLLNLGPRFTEHDYRLPSIWHLGLKGKAGRISGGLSVNKPLNTEIQYSAGIEYQIKYLYLRLGSRINNPHGSIAGGFGLRKGRFGIDYSFNPTDNGYESSHIVSLMVGI